MKNGTTLSSVPKAAISHEQPVIIHWAQLDRYSLEIIIQHTFYHLIIHSFDERFYVPLGKMMGQQSLVEAVTNKPRCGL